MHRRDRPTIMITTGSTDYTDRRGSQATDWLSDLYAKRIDQVGGLGLAVGPLQSSYDQSERIEAISCMMDGLLLTGGAFDIHPDLYGAPLHPRVALQSRSHSTRAASAPGCNSRLKARIRHM